MEKSELKFLYEEVCKIVAKNGNTNIEDHISRFKELESIFPGKLGFYIIVNLATKQYEFLGKNQQLVSGINNKKMKKEGIRLLADQVHEEDGKEIVKKGYEVFLTMAKKHAGDCYDMIMQSNYRFRHEEGHFIHLVEQIQFIDTGKEDSLNYLLTYVYEIPYLEPFKGKILIKKASKEGGNFETLYEATFPDEDPIAKLSDREIEIIEGMAKGKSSRTIGKELYLSQHTVRTHRKNIHAKLGMKTSNEVVAYALTQGLI